MIHSNNNEKYFFEIYQDYDKFTLNEDQFFFKLKDKNGKIYLESRAFIHKTKCLKYVKLVIRNIRNEKRFIVEPTYFGWTVELTDRNGRLITECSDFDTEEEVINMIKDLKSISFKTPVIDKTK